jgi:hypothetical protein
LDGKAAPGFTVRAAAAVPNARGRLENQPVPGTVQAERQIHILEVGPEQLRKSADLQYGLSSVEGSAGARTEDFSRILLNLCERVSMVSLLGHSAQVVIVARTIDPDRFRTTGCH